ncbi:unnamed protein product, partial [Musa textilis]
AEAARLASFSGSSREWEGGGTRAENKGADEMGRRLEKGTLFQSSPSVSPSIFRGYKRKREERTLFRCRSSRLQDSRTCPTGLAQSLHSELFMSSWVPLRIPSWKPKSGPQYVSKFAAPGGNDQIFHKGNNIKPIKVPSVRNILGDVAMESVLLMKVRFQVADGITTCISN